MMQVAVQGRVVIMGEVLVVECYERMTMRQKR
jgi:hypothetical protein